MPSFLLSLVSILSLIREPLLMLLYLSPLTLLISSPGLLADAINYLKTDSPQISLALYLDNVTAVIMIASAIGMLRLKRWGYNLYILLLTYNLVSIFLHAVYAALILKVPPQTQAGPLLGAAFVWWWFRKDKYSDQFNKEEAGAG